MDVKKTTFPPPPPFPPKKTNKKKQEKIKVQNQGLRDILRFLNQSCYNSYLTVILIYKITGEIHSLNIVTVHEPGKIIGVCGLAFGIGLITDLLKHSDERRWMKKARYVCMCAKKIKFYSLFSAYLYPFQCLKKAIKLW